jgi:hypothetical protein
MDLLAPPSKYAEIIQNQIFLFAYILFVLSAFPGFEHRF